jgi:hypothetical protein
MIKISLIILAIFYQVSSIAQLTNDRIDLLLEQSDKYKSDGPNCYSTTLFAAGVIDDWVTVDNGLAKILTSKYCTEIKNIENVQKGDLLSIEGFDARYSGFRSHAALFVSPNEVFAKMGSSKTVVTSIENARKNIMVYMYRSSSECKKNALNPKYRSQCLERSLFPIYYRCKFEDFTKDINLSEYSQVWLELTNVRIHLEELILMNKRQLSINEYSSERLKLEQLENVLKDLSSNQGFNEIIEGFITDTVTQLDLIYDK